MAGRNVFNAIFLYLRSVGALDDDNDENCSCALTLMSSRQSRDSFITFLFGPFDFLFHKLFDFFSSFLPYSQLFTQLITSQTEY